MRKYLIVNKNFFFKKKLKNSKEKKFFFISKKNNLNLKAIKKIKPDIIFFPHWSWKIKKTILTKYNCIGFHSTPLPFGRGGSPIQNMVLRGFKKTKICAFKITSKFDSGSIYLKEDLDLNGDGHVIFEKMYVKIFKMIVSLSNHIPIPKAQKGRIVIFKRLPKENSNLKKNLNLKMIYNLIRVLDTNDKNYLNAYVQLDKVKFSFTKAKFKRNKIEAKVIIEKVNF